MPDARQLTRGALYRQADAALYRCKRQNRGTISIFDPDRDQVMDDPASEGAAIAIRDIVRTRSLTPVYQPIVDLRDRRRARLRGPHPARARPRRSRTPASSSRRPPPSGRTVELDLACFEVVAAGRPGDRRTAGREHQPLAADARGARLQLVVAARDPRALLDQPGPRHRGADRARGHRRHRPAAAQRRDAPARGHPPRRRRRRGRERRPAPPLAGPVRHREDRPLARAGRRAARLLARGPARRSSTSPGARAPSAIAEGVETAEQLRMLRELQISTGQGYLLGRPGHNMGLSGVDLAALLAGRRRARACAVRAWASGEEGRGSDPLGSVAAGSARSRSTVMRQSGRPTANGAGPTRGARYAQMLNRGSASGSRCVCDGG